MSVRHPRPYVLSLLITERRLLCRHRSAEKDIAVKKKQRMKRKFLAAETKGSFSKGSRSVKSLLKEREAGNESDVIVRAARESHMLAAR